MSVNARRRQLQRVVDCDPRVVKIRDDLQAIRRVILDFQKRQADGINVMEILRDRHDELEREIRHVERSIFNPKGPR